MLLAVDIGNTHSVFGVYDDAGLRRMVRVSSDPKSTAHELWAKLHVHLSDFEITGVMIASVVPTLTAVCGEMCEQFLAASPRVLGPDTDVGFVCVPDRAQVGPDRLANTAAAFKLASGPAVVVDLGTATTYDVVDGDGRYLGGAIAPGVETAAADLVRRASRLGPVGLRSPERTVGATTRDAMLSGIIYGAADAVDGMIERIGRETGLRFVVFATGGLAELISKHTKTEMQVVPTLTLDGLRIIWQRT